MTDFAMRQVHLDFHTSPLIPNVGADWDADDFVDTLKRARVNSINLFAKCHHGMNYYPSKIGPAHPSLTFDLLGAQIDACHRAGIHCPIYISVGFDVSAAARHPEWRQVGTDGKLVGHTPLDSGWAADGWPWLCVNNGYADELVAQTEELLSLYDCDGFWYDILMHGPLACVCANCLESMRREGLDPADPVQRTAHNNLTMRSFMERATNTIRARKPDAGIFYNCRPWAEFENEAHLHSQVEIESLPTGGWGYGFYPLWARYARRFGLPMLGMTGRFHRSWADWGGLKHPDALRYECGSIVAAGGAICVGDQMHPRGRLNGAVYRVIGEAFQDVQAVEEYCHNAQPVTDVGLLMLNGATDAVQGAGKMLLERHAQFDLITPGTADFTRYKVLIVPDEGAASPDVVARLRDFVNGGGRLLVSGTALLDEDTHNFALPDVLGVDYLGPADCNPDYFQITEPALHGPVMQPAFAYCLYDGPTSRVSPHAGTAILADAHETYFNRTWEHFCSHGFTPPLAEAAPYPAAARTNNAVYIYGPVFAAFQRHGNLTFRALVGGCLDLLLPAPVLQTDVPATAEVSVTRQPGRTLVHIVNYHASRRATGHVEALETPVPLRDITVRVRTFAPCTGVRLARAGTVLSFTEQNGYVTVTVPRVDTHEIVVLSDATGG